MSEADAWDEGFRAGRQYEADYLDWWDEYDDELAAEDNPVAPHLPGNPYRPIESEEAK